MSMFWFRCRMSSSMFQVSDCICIISQFGADLSIFMISDVKSFRRVSDSIRFIRLRNSRNSGLEKLRHNTRWLFDTFWHGAHPLGLRLHFLRPPYEGRMRFLQDEYSPALDKFERHRQVYKVNYSFRICVAFVSGLDLFWVQMKSMLVYARYVLFLGIHQLVFDVLAPFRNMKFWICSER